ncbi:MAG: sigma-54-dependent Fis family transcriptional regulator [Halobacteriovoraceae bacterium]|nr:sigma-54-dependent Fis family transcriptional regulator [Halobacteriovoraceae bacterium]MCB9095972.1 sigma-54-dependent Fis family transcriptional regulator [Halobacteriovoraceae bacterium]
MSQSLRILLVEDDKYIAHLLKKFLKNYGIVELASDSKMALQLLHTEQFDLALIDLNLEEALKGLEVLQKAKSQKIYSIVLSNYENHQATKLAYQLGCDHFLKKQNFEKSLGAYLDRFVRENNSFNFSQYFKEKFITCNDQLIREIKNLSQVNLKDRCLLITGPTGVGKTHLAKLLHQLNFNNNHFEHLNCSEVPENLIESELFGYQKGAFTGADHNKTGILKRVDGGTLFLDEIATMPIYTQQKLLKAIEEKEFYPLGAEKPTKVNFTLISATCEDLNKKIDEGKFRRDFYFRLSGFELNIPPLCMRPEDIEIQIEYFLSQSERKFFLEKEVMELLKSYTWPGNTRELKKLIDTFSQERDGIITINHPRVPQNSSQSKYLNEQQYSLVFKIGLKNFIQLIERELVQKVMNEEQGKVSRSIKRLKISNSAFYRMLQQSETESHLQD